MAATREQLGVPRGHDCSRCYEMSSSPKPTFGAHVVRLPSSTAIKPAILAKDPELLDSPALTPATSYETLRDQDHPARPYSPFYHKPSSPAETTPTRLTTVASFPDSEKGEDVEIAIYEPISHQSDHDANPFTSKISVDRSKECEIWPSRQTLADRRLEEKQRRRKEKFGGACFGPVSAYWQRSSRRRKLWIKILVGLIIVGVVIAIGLGISIAVNGTVYVSEGSSSTIDTDS